MTSKLGERPKRKTAADFHVQAIHPSKIQPGDEILLLEEGIVLQIDEIGHLEASRGRKLPISWITGWQLDDGSVIQHDIPYILEHDAEVLLLYRSPKVALSVAGN